MTQQQLLLSVLSIIIVGIAIVVGINVFGSSAIQTNHNAVVLDCLTIAARALTYSRTPVSMGGGFDPTIDIRSFTGLTREKLKWPAHNANASNFTFTVTATQLTIVATSIEDDVSVTTKVWCENDSIHTTINDVVD